YHAAGPINLRPFLDKAWYQGGGQNNVSVMLPISITLSLHSVGPPAARARRRRPGARRSDDSETLLAALQHRKEACGSLLQQPFVLRGRHRTSFCEDSNAERCGRQVEQNPHSYVQPGEVEKRNVSAMEQVDYGPVGGHGGSTFGNLDNSLPRKYPGLTLQKYETLLHCRTGELYLGAGTFCEQLSLSLHWDRNVFSDDVVREWVDETRRAIYFYLGDTLTATSKL
ncbi:hypothetical protein B0H17DRAFT_1099186, partial [Mycena rosella]